MRAEIITVYLRQPTKLRKTMTDHTVRNMKPAIRRLLQAGGLLRVRQVIVPIDAHESTSHSHSTHPIRPPPFPPCQPPPARGQRPPGAEPLWPYHSVVPGRDLAFCLLVLTGLDALARRPLISGLLHFVRARSANGASTPSSVPGIIITIELPDLRISPSPSGQASPMLCPETQDPMKLPLALRPTNGRSKPVSKGQARGPLQLAQKARRAGLQAAVCLQSVCHSEGCTFVIELLLQPHAQGSA